MGTHSLGGSASVEVISVRGDFKPSLPTIDRFQNFRHLKYSKPESVTETAKITFRLKTKNAAKEFMFGIKQFCRIVSHDHLLKGNKSTDGIISESFSVAGHPFLLDVAAQSLTVLFDAHDFPTGARAVAPQAPFFSDSGTFVKDGVEIELSIVDAPGAMIPLELRNAATDRLNYLDSINIKQTFLTVLTAVSKSKVHTPLEAALWRQTVNGSVIWDDKGQPDIKQVSSILTSEGRFPTIEKGFLFADFDLLANASLTAADSVVQRYNDALFTVKGLYAQQDFTKATKTETRLAAKGFEIVQSPTF